MLTIPFKATEESPWFAFAGSLVVVGMLVLFYSVVSGAVQAGELRRKAQASQTTATLRCNALPNWSDKNDCLKEMGTKVSAQQSPLFASR